MHDYILQGEGVEVWGEDYAEAAGCQNERVDIAEREEMGG